MNNYGKKNVIGMKLGLLVLTVVLLSSKTAPAQVHISGHFYGEMLQGPQVSQRVIQEYLNIISKPQIAAGDQALGYCLVAKTLKNLGEGEKATFFYDKAIKTIDQQEKAEAYQQVADILQKINDSRESYDYREKSRRLKVDVQTRIQVLSHLAKKDAAPIDAYEILFEKLPPEEHHHAIDWIITRYIRAEEYIAGVQALEQLKDRFPESQKQEYYRLLSWLVTAPIGRWQYDKVVATAMEISDDQTRQSILEQASIDDMSKMEEKLNFLKYLAAEPKRKLIDEQQFQATLQTRYPEREFTSFDECFRYVFEDHLVRVDHVKSEGQRYHRLSCLIKWAMELNRDDQARELLKKAFDTAKSISENAENDNYPAQMRYINFATLIQPAKQLGEIAMAEELFLLSKGIDDTTLESGTHDNLSQMKSEIQSIGFRRFALNRVKREKAELIDMANDETVRLADRIELLNVVIQELYQNYQWEEAQSHIAVLFSLVDRLAENAEFRSEDDNQGALKASMIESFSYPVVQKHRQAGANIVAWDLARKLYNYSSSSGVDFALKQIVDDALRIGDVEGAIAFGEDNLDCLGPIIQELCKRGEREEANRLLDKGLAIMADRGEIAHEMVVALVICGRCDEAVNFTLEATQKAMQEPIPEEQSQDRRFIPSVFVSLVRSMLVYNHDERLVELLKEWPNEEEKLSGIILVINRHAAGNSPDVVFSEESLELWKNCLLNDARTEVGYLDGNIKRRIEMAKVLARIDAKQEAIDLLNEALALVDQLQISSKQNSFLQQELQRKIEFLQEIAKIAAKMSEMDMTEDLLLKVLEICQTNDHYTNKINNGRGVMTIYGDYFNKENLSNPKSFLEYHDPAFHNVYLSRDYWEETSFMQQYLSLPQ